ncbi:MAG: hypothetical protein KJ063_26020 [Anaerolineae bacterium]|nr:hypothetical protein [Anaerolineae bacterium]
MGMSFQYDADPGEIRAYIKEQGYIVDRIYGLGGREIGFQVRGTTLRLSYDTIIENHQVGHGVIHMLPIFDDKGEFLDSITKDRYLKLYRTLYNCFHKKDR